MVNKLIAISIVTILASAAVIGVFIQQPSNNNPNQITPSNSPNVYYKPQITNFSLDGFDNPVGIAWNSKFIVRITSDVDVDDLNIVFEISSACQVERTIELFNPYYYATFKVGEPYRLGALKAGQTIEIDGVIVNNLEDWAKLSGATFTAILKKGDTVLDRASIDMAVWGA